MKLLFVTNLCPHYRVKTFETLARYAPTHFVFFSQGGERYWNPRFHGRLHGDFPHEYLQGVSLGPMRITPALVSRVWKSEADVIIKCITGRFALPATFFLARLRHKPFVLWTGVWAHPQSFFHRLTYPLTRFLYLHADAIVVYGSHVRDYLTSVGVRPERIFVAWHAVDNATYSLPVSPETIASLRAELKLGDRPVILYVGRLEPVKGLDTLLEAVSQIADLAPALILIGAGEVQAPLARQARANGLDIRFVPYVPTGDLHKYYALCQVFVLPSVTTALHKEPWGLVVNEAMNQAAPILATDAVGAAAGGLVRDGETGLVVPERDAGALASALRKLLTDPALAKHLGAAGRAEVASWTNQRMVQGFIAAAEYALAKRSLSHKGERHQPDEGTSIIL